MQTTHDPLNQKPTPDVRAQHEQPLAASGSAADSAVGIARETGTPEVQAQERLLREKRLKKTVLRVGVGLLAGVVCAGLLVLTVMYS